MTHGKLLIAAYVVVAMAPAALAVLFVTPHFANLYREIAKLFALTAATMLMLQPVLSARLRCIERPFGLDIVLRFHRNMAVLALVLLLAHPVLIAISGAGWSLLYSIDLPWYILTGKAALGLVIVNVLASLLFSRLPITFERWRLGHDILGPVILLLIVLHAPILGHDLTHGPQRYVAFVVFAVVAGLFVYHRLIRPRLLAAHPWTVGEVRKEAEGVHTVVLEPPPGRAGYTHDPGQFHFITFKRGRSLPEEEHHWTISSSAQQAGAVASTIKNSGDFTSTIDQTRAGDTAVVHGPFGRFSYVHYPERQLCFVAGGIGITPLMSMLRTMRDRGETRSVVLLYANRTREDIVFAEELAAMANMPGGAPDLRLVHVLSRPDEDWDGERGHIDRALIEKHIQSPAQHGWYLCGPGGLVQAVLGALSAMEVPDHRIHKEKFTFLD